MAVAVPVLAVAVGVGAVTMLLVQTRCAWLEIFPRGASYSHPFSHAHKTRKLRPEASSASCHFKHALTQECFSVCLFVCVCLHVSARARVHVCVGVRVCVCVCVRVGAGSPPWG